ncbi:MAG: hypothetical protein JOZ54_17560 [Acidobacteria bacterium]|nr:hypothetical protein [Acidobacteriota bacterium]
MARTNRIALLLILMILVAGCGLLERTRARVTRMAWSHVFAVHRAVVLTQSTFRANDVVAAPVKKEPVKRAVAKQKPEVITGPIEFASLRLPVATVGVRSNDAAVFCTVREPLPQKHHGAFRRLVVISGAQNASIGG